MLVQHGRLAAEVGVLPENIFIIENGQSIEYLPNGTARRGIRVEAGYVFVDGLSVGEVGDIVLRDRRALANDGMLLVVVTVDKQTGNLVGKPEIVTRGFVNAPDDKLLAGATERIARSIENPGDHLSEIALLKAQIKDALSQYLYEQTKRRPMVFPGGRRGLGRWPAPSAHPGAAAEARHAAARVARAPRGPGRDPPPLRRVAGRRVSPSRRARFAHWSGSCSWCSARSR